MAKTKWELTYGTPCIFYNYSLLDDTGQLKTICSDSAWLAAGAGAGGECAANIQTVLTPANAIQFSGQNLLGTDENFCPLGTRYSWQLELVLYPYVFRAEVH